MHTSVLIVGAGPVGLTLAINLGLRGIACTLIEQKETPQFLPKMERCNARTMEMSRRLGLAEPIRAHGFPATAPMDVFIVTSLIEQPLLRLPYPSVAEAREIIRATNDGSAPLEPYQLISQYTLEPLLKKVCESLPNVTVRYGRALEVFEQDAEKVSAIVRMSGGKTEKITADYMAGCDGGASIVRKSLDIKLRGKSNLLTLRQALYRCDDLFERIPVGKGRHYHVADDRSTFLIVQDDTKHFTLHSVVEQDSEMAKMFEKTVAMPVEYEMIYVGQWKQKLLLADSYGVGRVFLAGDSVHLVVPTGGLGVNTGVGDATDLSWKLAATIQGWGGPDLLRSYEIERRQVGERNVQASTYAARGRRRWRTEWLPKINDKTPEGEACQRRLAKVADVEQRKTNEMIGAELGYRYADSPIIVREDGEPPEHNFMDYLPSSWPGFRLPHVWADDGTAIQDRIGAGYTFIKLGGARADVSVLANSMRRIGAPFEVLELADEAPRRVYGCDFILLRPDMHIVWRGNAPPKNAEELASLATGHCARAVSAREFAEAADVVSTRS